MDWGAWAIIGTSAVGLAITFVATAVKMTWWLGAKLDEITKIQDERHAENRERFAKLEMAILKNGHSRRRKA